MATTSTTSSGTTVPESPAVPVDPGIITGTTAVGFVALNRDDASVQRILRGLQTNLVRIGWSDLVLLKLLVPQESQEVIVSHFGNAMLQDVVQVLLAEVRSRT